jgi:hypothetical protein
MMLTGPKAVGPCGVLRETLALRAALRAYLRIED